MRDPQPSPAQFFDAEHAAFDRQYQTDPSFKERFELWTDLIDTYGREGARVLDVGCGTGLFSCHAAMRGMRVVGLDPAEGMLEIAERRRKARGLDDLVFRKAALEGLGELGLRGELVLCSSVLEYLDNLEAALSVLAATVDPGGYLVISLPNAACLYRKVETVVYRLTGRPRYRALIRTLATHQGTAAMAVRHGLIVRETRFYAKGHRLGVLNALLTEDHQAALFLMVLQKRPAS